MNFIGCATLPQREALPVYNLHNASYLALSNLCASGGINWDYDTLSRTITLTRDAHKINMMLGDDLVLVDGRLVNLRHPVDIYQGIIVVPRRFKEEILDNLFKEYQPRPKPAALPSRIRKVIIDAGHGGKDPGAIGQSGLREKVVTLDIAKRLAKILEANGIDVVMTRSSDRFISLPQRVNIANNSGADIFLSIHANANRVRRLYGFEAYYVSGTVDDSKRALAAAQQAALKLENCSLTNTSLNLKAILWDMIYTHNRAESIELARSICKKVNRNLDTKILGVKDARFYILKGARTPAVLVETGFLSNRKEERMLRNGYYRQAIAESIAQGLISYGQEIAFREVSLR